ncbi:MAG TPA: orotate phosphoribosyltransferase [Candidatus Cloacimonadota bacterium]|nr:orotate phosphoribosyltransferase [Candidatus Cloacimonadota bacterium]
MDIQEVLKETNALLKGHFKLTSGRHSEYYVEKIKIIHYPDKVEILCKEIANKLKDYPIDVVVGPAYGGIALAYEVARQMGKKFIFTQRKDDQMTIRSGFDIKAGDNAVIIEDIITTGGSVVEVIDVLKEYQINVQAVACIVDRSAGKAQFECPLIPLTKLSFDTWEEQDCPLCKNNIPLKKPGASDKKI